MLSFTFKLESEFHTSFNSNKLILAEITRTKIIVNDREYPNPISTRQMDKYTHYQIHALNESLLITLYEPKNVF